MKVFIKFLSETGRVIRLIKKNTTWVKYINDNYELNRGFQFKAEFEGCLKNKLNDSSFDWNKVDWDKVADCFLG